MSCRVGGESEGSSKYAMFQWVIPISVNIILDPIFIFALKLGIEGAAIATVISQSVSVFMWLYYFFLSGKTQLVIKWKDFLPGSGGDSVRYFFDLH
jgi:Na+-driven multidrug efflux pump